jgi:uncharacterized membrane protein
MSSGNPVNVSPVNQNDDPLTVLKLRYAKGEINKEQYEEMKKVLE